MSWFRAILTLLLGFTVLCMAVRADGPDDNRVQGVRPIPARGTELAAEQRQTLTERVARLEEKIAHLSRKGNPFITDHLPDVEIFSRAIHLALRDEAFYEPTDYQKALEVLEEGAARAQALEALSTPWKLAPEATVRGFRSKLDGTVQPYGVVFNHSNPLTGRADVWCRGRSEKGLELQFLHTRLHQTDPLPAPGVIMIHPFGRYCNANKLAGEIDTLEAIEHAVRDYGIDRRRIAIRGFSMGGAAAWHLAVHYPDRWFAANPGAGFSETPDFLKVFQSESLEPYGFERTLWQYYDCPVWVRNLRMLPTIAYSGALDKQKQAADVMAKACWELPERERFELTHIVAPHTAHQVASTAREEIERRLRELDEQRPTESPRQLSFTTVTLRYNRAHWLTVDALDEHWVPSTIHATRAQNQMDVYIEAGIRQFTLELGLNDLQEAGMEMTTTIWTKNAAGQVVAALKSTIARRSDRSWGATFRNEEGQWVHVSPLEQDAATLQKRHLLQGPIDDAFMGPFLFVRPSGPGFHPEIDQWVESELARAVREWQRQMRGEVRVVTADEVTAEDLRRCHLIYWGDPQSNTGLAKVIDQLPVRWNRETLSVGKKSFDVNHSVPVLIFPNPLAPDRYVVLNSGFTYREYDYLNNARQVPKLPDWAIVDVSTPPSARWAGRIVEGGFFDEAWQIRE